MSQIPHSRGVLAALLVACLACGSDPQRPRWAPAERLVGSWRWVRSIDVKTSDIHTPASSGFEASLEFAAESERSGSYVYTRSDAARISGKFTIGSEDAPGNDFISIDHPIDFLTQNAWIAASADSLDLSGVREGGFNSTYARVR
jgi:hypothetical protein